MNNTLLELYNSDGHYKYMRKIVEELNELACAISYYEDEKANAMDVLEEVADVYLQLKKLETYFIEICDLNKTNELIAFNLDKKFRQLM